jgi:hypothetical protein
MTQEVAPLRSTGFELRLTQEMWKTVIFPRTEARLGILLLDLATQSEGSRAASLKDVSRQLECCEIVGRIANIPLPTPIMSVAQEAIDTTTIM